MGTFRALVKRLTGSVKAAQVFSSITIRSPQHRGLWQEGERVLLKNHLPSLRQAAVFILSKQFVFIEMARSKAWIQYPACNNFGKHYVQRQERFEADNEEKWHGTSDWATQVKSIPTFCIVWRFTRISICREKVWMQKLAIQRLDLWVLTHGILSCQVLRSCQPLQGYFYHDFSTLKWTFL